MRRLRNIIAMLALLAPLAATAQSDPPVDVITVTRSPPDPNAPVPVVQKPIGDQTCKNPDAPPAPLGKKSAVAIRIRADGSIENVKLFMSSGDPKLDSYAMLCAWKWRFTPLPDDAPRMRTVTIVPISW